MSTNKTLMFINTAPKANTKKTGEVFYTVLIGLSKSVMAAKGHADTDRLTMNVFPSQLETISKAFKAAKEKGVKLAIEADDIIITEPKTNTYVNREGEQVTEIQASCWADGPARLTLVKSTLTVSDELEALLAEDGDEDPLV